LIATHIKLIAVELEHSQSRYFFKVTQFLYSSDIGTRGLLSTSMEGSGEGFGGHSSKSSMKNREGEPVGLLLYCQTRYGN